MYLICVITEIAVIRVARGDRQARTVDDLNELIAIFECIVANVGHALGDLNADEILFTVKGFLTDSRYGIAVDRTRDHENRVGTGTHARDRAGLPVAVDVVGKSDGACCVQDLREDLAARRADTLLQAVLRLGRGRYGLPFAGRMAERLCDHFSANRTDLRLRTGRLRARAMIDFLQHYAAAIVANNALLTGGCQTGKDLFGHVRERFKRIGARLCQDLHVGAVVASRNASVLAVRERHRIARFHGNAERYPIGLARHAGFLQGIVVNRQPVKIIFRGNSVLQEQVAIPRSRDHMDRIGSVIVIGGATHASFEKERRFFVVRFRINLNRFGKRHRCPDLMHVIGIDHKMQICGKQVFIAAFYGNLRPFRSKAVIINVCQIAAIFERAIADHRYADGNLDARQSRAICKRIRADLRYAVRDLDRRQTQTHDKRAVSDIRQSFGKRDRR